MNKERNAFKAGLFILISIALIVSVIVAIQGFDSFFEPIQRRTVTFKLNDNLSGLDKGDDVRVGGVKIGKVSRIVYVPDADAGKPMLIVHFHIPAKYKLKAGAVIRIESTVTGAANLNIANLGDGTDLPENTALVGQTGGVAALLAKADDAIASIKDTAVAAQSIVKKVDDRIDPAIAKYNTLADRGAEMMVAIRDMIGPATTDFKGFMANLNVATTTIKEKLPGLLDEARNTLTKLQTTIDSATVAMEDIKKGSSNLKDVTASARGILVGNRTKFDDIIAGLKSASDNIDRASAELRRSPWRLLYKPNPGELDNLVLFDSAREFSTGANDLNDAAQALKDAIHEGDVPAEDLQKKIDLLDRTFNKFNGVEQKLWKAVKE